MKTNTKGRGDLAELEVLRFFHRCGYSVSIPFGENNPYDVIAESPSGKLYRIQVRWCSWEGDALNISLRIISKNYVRTIELARIDAFAVFDGEHVYVIPTSCLGACRATFSLRRAEAKNGQKKRINEVHHFREAVHLLP